MAEELFQDGDLIRVGTREEAEAFSALVRKGHDKVTGPGYEAHDPELQVWVAATLFAVATQFYQLLFRRRFDMRELADFYRQTKVYATILGCPEDRMPGTYPEFRAYYADMVQTLRISDASRAIADQVLDPRMPLGPAAEPDLKAIRLITAGLMPQPIRDQYGWEWNAARERRFRLLMATLSAVYPRLPLRLRTLPREYYMSTTRQMLRTASSTHLPADYAA